MECKTCSTEMTKMETGCVRCLKCYPLPKSQPKPKEVETKYIDIPWTEERIRDIVRDELENWHSTAVVTKQVNGFDGDPEVTVTKVAMPNVVGDVETNWREKAKELGIPLFQRKKEDVLAEIEEKLNVPVEG